MRQFLIIIAFLGVYFSLDAQYKRLSIGIEAITHDFNSGYFYSSPGVHVGLRLNRFFSFESGFSQETVKHHAREFNDLHGSYYYINNRMSYYQAPLTFKASFGKKLLVDIGVGATFFFGHQGYDDGFDESVWLGDTTRTYFEQEYNPRTDGLPFMVHVNAGVSYPIAKRLIIGVKAQRTISLEFVQDDTHNFRYFNDYKAFRLMKYSAYICYQFNFSRKKNFEFHAIELFK
ncbi:MAG: hypothetical protein ACOVO3_09035 [Fluviicola sp.]|jgi:hypothetical protein